ncbi:MAG: TonB-dependent receptor [Bacteroidales bacterium]|nr:TonB-dependent receptor [Bacteroidales bacterium]
MYKIFIILFFSSFMFSTQAQENDILISGNFINEPFLNFVQTIENSYDAHFYFNKDWVEDITVKASGNKLSLFSLLKESLDPKDIHFFIDKNHNVFITNTNTVITRLPDYKIYRNIFEENTDEDEGNGLTTTEKAYIKGRKTRQATTINIGNPQVSGGKKAIINGKIREKESKEPLLGATVYIEEMQTGVASDIDGQFNMVITPGRYTAVFRCLGMKEEQYFLQVYTNGTIEVEMEKELIAINEVTIKADRYHNVRGTQMGYERLTIKSIKEIPVVMGERDLLKVAQMLPGVQNVGEGSSGFNIRGSSADQNMFYINKVPVYNTSHLFGFFTSFSPDIVNDFTLFKSNIPAKYGGRLASVFDITTRQGNKTQYTMRGGISPVTGHIAAEGPLIKDKSSFSVSARSTYSDWILSKLKDADLRNSNAAFYDLAANVKIEPGPYSLVKVFGYYSHDQFTLSSTHTYEYSNSGGSIIWRQRFNPSFFGEFVSTFGNYNFNTVNNVNVSEAYSHSYNINHYEFRSDFTLLIFKNQNISFGANSIYYNLNRGYIKPYGLESLRMPIDLGVENGIEGAFYLSDEIILHPKLTVNGGLRYSFYNYLGPAAVTGYIPNSPLNENNILDTLYFSKGDLVKTYSGPEFRVALNYLLGKNNSIKFSYNRIRQYIFMLSNTVALSPTDQWKLSDYHIRPPYADQVSAGYYHDFPNKGISSSVEVYNKWIYNVLEYKDGASFISTESIETQTLQGDQNAYGVEVMIKKNTGKLTGWLAYSYSKSVITVNGPLIEEKINFGNSYPANYDRPHGLNLVTNIRSNRRLSMSANLVYNTGRPISYPVSVYYINDVEYVNYSSRNKYRIPDYFRIDLSINLEGNLKSEKLAHSYWMLNIYNLTGRKNAYSVFYQTENGKIKGYKMSIFGQPLITLSWNFKLGNYASE